MKRHILALAALLGMSACPVLAQSPAPAPQVVGHAAPGAAQMPRQVNIWDYQKELGLSADQVTKLKGYMTSLQSKMRDAQATNTKLTQEATVLVKADADLPKIREKLNQMATLMVDVRMADIETRRNIEKTLTKDQLAKWGAIRSKLQAQTQGHTPTSLPRPVTK